MRRFEGFMHGVNLGGWLSQKDSDAPEYMDTFITEDDIAAIGSMHLDHVRVPVDYTTIETEDGAPIGSGYAHIDDVIGWAEKYGLHVLIDLHKTHGYTFDPMDKGADREAFFHDPKEQERFYRLWERIVRRYVDKTDMVAFELLNEIVSPKITEEWNNVADAAVERIRAIAPDAWIVIGGVRYNNVTSVPLLHKPADEHIVFNFHCYDPILFTHQKAYWVDNMPSDLDVAYPDSAGNYVKLGAQLGLKDEQTHAMEELPPDTSGRDIFEAIFQPAVQTAEKYNIPLYCGEYGVIDRAPAADTLRWTRDITSVFDEYGIARALWNYKAKDFGLIGPHYADIRNDMITCL